MIEVFASPSAESFGEVSTYDLPHQANYKS